MNNRIQNSCHIAKKVHYCMSLLKIFCTVSKLMNILLFFYSDGKHSFKSSLNFHHLLRLVQNSNEVLRFKFLVLAWRFIDCNACFALSVRLWHQQTCWAILVTQFSAWIQCSCTWRYQGAGHQVRNRNKQIKKKIREAKIKLTKQLQIVQDPAYTLQYNQVEIMHGKLQIDPH